MGCPTPTRAVSLFAAVFVFVFVFFVADFGVALVEGGFGEEGGGQAGVVFTGGVESLVNAAAIVFTGDLQRRHNATEALVVGVNGGVRGALLEVGIHGNDYAANEQMRQVLDGQALGAVGFGIAEFHPINLPHVDEVHAAIPQI